jgi:predicted aldo/keto reductase-like oxidoreductase
MRLPTIKGEYGNIDEPVAIKMIRDAIDAGVNYVDTAKPYHDGVGEKLIGKALEDGYREKVLVASKLPVWLVESEEHADQIFQEQLDDLRTDKIDVYLLHCLQAHTWEKSKKLKLVDWLQRKRGEGKIDYLGFSFHDGYNVFPEVLEGGPWDMCQLQYNYVGENVQAGTRGVRDAHQRGLAVVVMEPLFGGVLADPPGEMGQEWEDSPHRPVDLALRWLWDREEISLVLSGMSEPKHVEENLASAEQSGVGTLTDREREFIARMQKKFDDLVPIKCTRCRYCLPCPEEVNIPLNFETYNNAVTLPENAAVCRTLYSMMDPIHRANHCVECGVCEERCPQGLPIREDLKTVHQHLAKE